MKNKVKIRKFPCVMLGRKSENEDYKEVVIVGKGEEDGTFVGIFDIEDTSNIDMNSDIKLVILSDIKYTDPTHYTITGYRNDNTHIKGEYTQDGVTSKVELKAVNDSVYFILGLEGLSKDEIYDESGKVKNRCASTYSEEHDALLTKFSIRKSTAYMLYKLLGHALGENIINKK